MCQWIAVVVVVQLLSHVHFFATPWTAACQASLSFIITQVLFKLMSLEFVMPSNHLILCCPLLLPPSIFPSIRVFSNESVLHTRQPKYWSLSLSISPSNEYSGFISFRIDWFDLLALQSTLNFLMGATCNGKKQDAALVDRAVLSKTLIHFSVVLMGGAVLPPFWLFVLR